MPGRDNTGPMGMGPMTGRGLGNCAGNTAATGRGAGPGFGRGLKFGGGRGRGGRGGRGNRFRAIEPIGGQPPAGDLPGDHPSMAASVVNDHDELDALKRQAAQLAGTLEQINQRITQLETSATEE